MKILSFLLFILIGFSASSQSFAGNEETGVAVSLSGGYASNQRATGSFSLGAQVRDNWFSGQNHISADMQVFSDPGKVGTPAIFECRIGHVFNDIVEIYAGYGYHKSKTDAVEMKSRGFDSGLKPAFGIVKRSVNSWWIISAGMSGNICSVKLGIMAIR